jgi:hypothetical protein
LKAIPTPVGSGVCGVSGGHLDFSENGDDEPDHAIVGEKRKLREVSFLDEQ